LADALEDCERHLTWFINKAKELDLQSAGLTTAPWSADYAIHPIFDQFFEALEPKFRALTCSLQGLANPRYPWLRAKGYADAMEFKDNWHFVNSEDGSIMFAVDCGWNVSRVGLELFGLEQEDWDHLKRNINFVLDALGG